ncbi:MAG: 3-ketoacyl-ACP reductase [Saprospiraceae bacterium]|nr:3-ketoacyl-ACP reductase [Saprospiraceae bacterium]
MKKIALVTGGTRGIGLGIAHSLAAEGWSLVLNGMRPVNLISEIIENLRLEYSTDVQYVQGNIAHEGDREQIVRQAIERFGQIHLLVNNAGVAPKERLDILETTEESYERVMDINLKGPFFLTQIIASEMITWKKHAPNHFFCIVNVGSISATIASISRGEYCLSKAGMAMMTNLFAVRLGEADIPVYEIRPGVTATDMTSGVKEKYDAMIADGLTVQRRWGVPSDTGKAVAALARGDFAYSTGQIIMTDGGHTINRL